MDYLMSEQLRSGVCESCFSFRGVTSRPDPAIKNSTVPISFPICASTLHPRIGHCTHKPSKISAASQRSRPVQSKSKPSKSTKVMVSIGDKLYEQGHFNDFLKLLKQERIKRNG